VSPPATLPGVLRARRGTLLADARAFPAGPRSTPGCRARLPPMGFHPTALLRARSRLSRLPSLARLASAIDRLRAPPCAWIPSHGSSSCRAIRALPALRAGPSRTDELSANCGEPASRCLRRCRRVTIAIAHGRRCVRVGNRPPQRRRGATLLSPWLAAREPARTSQPGHRGRWPVRGQAETGGWTVVPSSRRSRRGVGRQPRLTGVER
jgi:hypothetical protein